MMPKERMKLHPAGGKRLVLVVDDERINREILEMILRDEYELLFASDGLEAKACLEEKQMLISLVLLDLQMPLMSGKELLAWMKSEPEILRIPVIVMTSDESAEVECLKLGAIDFIPKPYNQPAVILARILRTIELSEDRSTIRFTERDPLTGLYNREYFYRYASQMDLYRADAEMDAIVVDVNHFHIINERYGKTCGDDVLRRIGERLRETVSANGGIVCRKDGDTFLVYCPHREDYREILEHAAISLSGEEGSENRVRLRMGIYAQVDKEIDIERRFDRAKTAADTVRTTYFRPIAMYDSALHDSELYNEQLLEDFPRALEEKQFRVFFQPKFDIHGDIPALASAEALVRWQHPVLGMISPARFIPLFEDNGLIHQLDQYVWRETCACIRGWKDRLGFAVPVSVNVSRVDMYDPSLIDMLSSLLAEYELTTDDLLLEITESAYTEDSTQIIDAVQRLRAIGFRIEMDDFGTGYSSLNMISSLPIDALKLDMKFIRQAFQEGQDTRLIEIIIDIADYLSVPVIAEGVETQEQLKTLKTMGCDLVQGYYFSRPVPPEEYVRFIEERKARFGIDAPLPTHIMRRFAFDRSIPTGIVNALTSDFDQVFYVDTGTSHYVQFSTDRRFEDLQIERSGHDFFRDVQRLVQRNVWPEDRLTVALSLQRDTLLQKLDEEQTFSITYRLTIDGQPVYHSLRAIRAYTADERHIVIGISNVDSQILQEMEYERTKKESASFASIASALAADYFSIYYVDMVTDSFVEYLANECSRSLVIEAEGSDFFGTCLRNIPRVVDPEDRGRLLSVFTKENLQEKLRHNGTFTMTYRLIYEGRPQYFSLKATQMKDGRHIVVGVSNIDSQMRREEELNAALEMANRDALTGVKSKHAWVGWETWINERMAAGEMEPFAVAVCDINNLKKTNDQQGHQAGDELIRGACHVICETFKHSPVFRTGGDEFVAILTGQDYGHRAELMRSISQQSQMAVSSGGIVIAAGLGEVTPGDTSLADVFTRADTAMYAHKAQLKAMD